VIYEGTAPKSRFIAVSLWCIGLWLTDKEVPSKCTGTSVLASGICFLRHTRIVAQSAYLGKEALIPIWLSDDGVAPRVQQRTYMLKHAGFLKEGVRWVDFQTHI